MLKGATRKESAMPKSASSNPVQEYQARRSGDSDELDGDPSGVGDDLLWHMCYHDGSPPESLNLTAEEMADYIRWIDENRDGQMPHPAVNRDGG